MVSRMSSNESAQMKRGVRTCGVILAVTVGVLANPTVTRAQNDDKVKAGLEVWKNSGCAECHGSFAERSNATSRQPAQICGRPDLIPQRSSW